MHPERAREWTPQRVMAYGLPTPGCDSDEAVALREDQRGSGWKGGPCAPAGSAAVAHCSARSKTPTPLRILVDRKGPQWGSPPLDNFTLRFAIIIKHLGLDHISRLDHELIWFGAGRAGPSPSCIPGA